MNRFANKDPDEILDYPVDWTRKLYTAVELNAYKSAVAADPTKGLPTPPSTVVMPADRIIASRFALPAALTEPAGKPDSFTDTATLLWIDKGGIEGVTYVITHEVDTLLGRTLDQSFKLKVKSK